LFSFGRELPERVLQFVKILKQKIPDAIFDHGDGIPVLNKHAHGITLEFLIKIPSTFKQI
jgi:hypothetical protein